MISKLIQKKYELLAVGKKSEANEEDHILDDVTIKINCSIREVSFLGVWLINSTSFRFHNIAIEDLVKKILNIMRGKVNDKGMYIYFYGIQL